ncbi:MAG: DUF58 domain-containing protein [Candidatus Methylacidiphilales bacterium]|nr:DUF58 domain-containing protein [Candidatus Methylacidiphilales bacterium]
MSSQTVEELFSAEFLRRLESIALAARQLVKGAQRAQRRAVHHGASVEFAEYRPFTEGDDWRYIDWNAFARWRQLVLKLFVEEEDWHVHVLYDNSTSMNFGAPAKFDYARQVAAGLAYLGLANLDRVALVPLQSSAGRIWKPARGKEKFLLLLRQLAQQPLAPEAGQLEDHVRRWLSTRPRRGLVVLLSDLWGADLGDAIRTLDRLRYAGQEVGVIQMIDPAEQNPGDPGEYDLEDCETGTAIPILNDSQAARDYRRQFTQYQESISRYCKQNQIALIQTDTRFPVADLLLRTLRHGGFVE